MSDDRLADWIAVARQGKDAWVKSLALTEASVSDSPFGDLERALAAVERVLALAGEWEAAKPSSEAHLDAVGASITRIHGSDMMQAITRELLGEENGNAQD